jgi:peptidoglycan/LPS O-acetylase OafA/YrhL
MVFLAHYNYPWYGAFFRAVCYQFYLSMDIFFVLSGFLICYNYGKNVALNKPFLTWYYRNRIGRIVPLYYILVTFTFLMLYFRHEGGGGSHLFGIYLLNISFIKALSASYIFTGIYPAWSLTPEMTFYFLFPFMYVLITRYNFSWWKHVLLFWAIGLLVYVFFQFYPFKGFFKDFQFMLAATFFGRCFEFMIGVHLAFLFIKWQAKKNAINITSRVKLSVPVYTIAGSIVAIILILVLAYISPDKMGLGYSGIAQFLTVVVFPLPIAAMFFGLVTEVTWFSRLLSTSLFQVLGKSSYAFFLVHTGFIADWMFVLCRDNVLLVYLSVAIISIALYYLLESPLNKWIKGYYK